MLDINASGMKESLTISIGEKVISIESMNATIVNLTAQGVYFQEVKPF